jgi:hypothetical protein
MKRTKTIKYLLAATVFAVAGGGVALGFSLTRSQPQRAEAGRTAIPPVGTSSSVLQQRFAVLSQRHTNKCALRPQDVDTLAVNGRLQGSCCTPMVFGRYMQQVRGLAAYRDVRQIPRDPYDIPIEQAKQLLAYDSSITLTAAQQAIYRQAMKLSHEHGPCCCHCWRWPAFEGQAKYLMTRRRYRPSQIAQVWNLEDGCGGPARPRSAPAFSARYCATRGGRSRVRRAGGCRARVAQGRADSRSSAAPGAPK